MLLLTSKSSVNSVEGPTCLFLPACLMLCFFLLWSNRISPKSHGGELVGYVNCWCSRGTLVVEELESRRSLIARLMERSWEELGLLNAPCIGPFITSF